MRTMTSFAVAAAVGILVAVSPVSAAHHEGATDGSGPGFLDDLIENVQDTEKKLVALADAMPEELFGWTPSIEARTFSQTLIHVAGANFFIPVALGAGPPEGFDPSESPMAIMKRMEEEITGKQEVIAKLQASFAYVYEALPAIEDLDEKIELFGPPASKRSYFFVLQGHAHEHLGQAIAYARAVGVTPPWSLPVTADEESGEDDG